MAPDPSYVAPMPATGTSRRAVLEFAEAVALGLSDTPRWIPSRFLYDARGSQLFEAICELPEYYPTRTESGILERESARFRRLTGPVTLVELGSGSSVKTDHLLAAYAADGEPVHYVPVDVSASILRMAAERIEETFPSVNVAGVHGEYERVFPLLADYAPVLLLFLGSTIGNFNHAESLAFWRRVARAMPEDSWVLLGVDLVKDPAVLEAAYNDAAGVTATFTRNLFARMNAELGAGLDLDTIHHEARWNPEWQRIEIGARFHAEQVLDIAPLGKRFRIPAGELIMTEISRKFVLANLRRYLDCLGFETVHTATDERGWFGVLLLRRTGDGDRDDV
jgi:L-histidine N-alpha-methyltransferase